MNDAAGESRHDWVDEVTRRVKNVAPLVEEVQTSCAALARQNKALERKVMELTRFKLAVLEELEGYVSHCPSLVDAIKERKNALQV
ncbi:unnamed protein product [Phytomonas sp. EM1]|nr:unnamed protein product [Phytomonas sp. EM1]|eukprot:CCW65504.1 unnamed protein product [Phytomonas sp. isolate EM1]